MSRNSRNTATGAKQNESDAPPAAEVVVEVEISSEVRARRGPYAFGDAVEKLRSAFYNATGDATLTLTLTRR